MEHVWELICDYFQFYVIFIGCLFVYQFNTNNCYVNWRENGAEYVRESIFIVIYITALVVYIFK